jgi:ribosomal protein L19E
MAISELRKALTAGGSGSNIIREDIEPLIRANLLARSPALTMVPRHRADGNVHKVPKRTANIAGWVEGETTAATYSQSTYARRSLTIKILRKELRTMPAMA